MNLRILQKSSLFRAEAAESGDCTSDVIKLKLVAFTVSLPFRHAASTH